MRGGFHDSGRGSGRARPGLFETANGGTLVLNDVDAASPALQTAIARTMEERSYLPVGAAEPRPVSCRMIGIARRDLAGLVEAERFRADLFYSLSMVRIRIPPLRERRADVPLLFASFQADAAKRFNRPVPTLTGHVSRRLIDYDWPGNLRELQHLADRVVLGFDRLDIVGPDRVETSLPELVSDFEASVIRDALRATAGDTRAAIEKLKIPARPSTTRSDVTTSTCSHSARRATTSNSWMASEAS
ncbi:MAG TPA: sigma 54-interacting transcriptional regulator [Hyphomonadaceae bacterium]|nr:sigma 54-interacting transcriptional regulator [Hyphomonadaceae bacterium]